MRELIRRSPLLFSLPVIIVIIGTIGFMFIENLSFIDSLYFTIVTISTVGYGDIYPINTAGKIFGIILIVIGIGAFLTIVTNVTQILMQRGRERLRRQRLNIIIGVFFTEVGNQLLHLFVQYDDNINKIREDFAVKDQWDEVDFNQLNRKLRYHDFTINPELMDLKMLSGLLKEKGDLLLRQIENPELIEHESLTELLWSIIHLRDELLSRKSFVDLPESDLAHLANDAKRAYVLLVKQWISYLLHLKQHYPYLFSLALRINPYAENPSVIVK